MYNNHKIENIDAIVAVTNEDGKQQQCRISVGYCPRCKDFFIRQRSGMSNMELAISKWEAELEDLAIVVNLEQDRIIRL